MKYYRILGLVAVAAITLTGCDSTGNASAAAGQAGGVVDTNEPAPVPLPQGLDLGKGNRRTPIPGLPDWSKAGYRGGENLPAAGDYNPDAACRTTPGELAANYGVRADDDADDSLGLQKAIDDIRTSCSPKASFTKLSLIILPAGTLTVTRQLWVDADYLTIRGAGHSTRVVFRPDENTRYDTLTKDGSQWDQDAMTCGKGPKGGWIWPGRGLFRVQSQEIEKSYVDGCREPNRQDLVKGTVNAHWKAGLKLAPKPGDGEYSARAGDTVVHVAKADGDLKPGALVNVRAANTMKMYEEQKALPTEHKLQNLHMRQRIHRVAAVEGKTVTLDGPLEFDVPIKSTSDGAPEIEGAEYESKLAPLADPVIGVGFESFSFTQDMKGLPKAGGGSYDDLTPEKVRNDYGNFAPEYAMHGIVFKWAADGFVRNMKIEMTGSHPVVTEEARNLAIVNNTFDGAWNKGKGGNGYLRGSRVWDSVYADNISRNLRHFTMQWSASGNVVIRNDLDSDLNMHGGWERRNLFELNTVRIPFAHGPSRCTANCGGEVAGDDGETTWYPIWWGAGRKAVKWSGATGPQNVFFNNAMAKQSVQGGPFADYRPNGGDAHTVQQYGWGGGRYQHLERDGGPIADWSGGETANYAGRGVDTAATDPAQSLFLRVPR
ncbi:hypothetical protein [Herbihabitans rhizosphaerae]|nr:hypothetical protein [Herbihabitans rhizosphaerae]